MRGAYTAGALSWLIDNGIEFDESYGISTGAVHLCNYLLKNKKNLFEFSTKYITDKGVVGLKPILRCGHIVDYDFIFDEFLAKNLKFNIKELNNVKQNGKVGTYELKTGKAEYHRVQELELEELKAACTLPLLGKIAKLNDRKMLDAGITDMIPIEEAIKDGCNRHLIITTKPAGYVRKPSSKAVVEIMKLRYRDCPSVGNDYLVRHENYYKQISMIENLVNSNEAIYVLPSKKSNVSRLGGSRQELEELFDLGKADMEARKEDILAMFAK